jgi:hypothetical protein
MNDEVINYFPNIQTNTISPFTESGTINFLGNVKFNGIVKDYGYNTKKESTVDFIPLKNKPIYEIEMKFDKQVLWYYNNKFWIVKTIRLKFPGGYNDKFTLNVKENKEIFIQIKK